MTVKEDEGGGEQGYQGLGGESTVKGYITDDDGLGMKAYEEQKKANLIYQIMI